MATSSGTSKDELPMGIIMKESNSYFCEYCSCILAGFSCMQQHVAGKRHKKEMQRSGIIIPPKKEIAQLTVIAEDTSISNEAVCASYNTNGIVECEEKWNTFQCVYCNCILNAGDVNLHIGGKRHKKRANQAALENFIIKRNENNDPKPVEIVAGRTENTANFQEGKNDPLSKSPMPAWQQIPECSMKELDEVVKRKNTVNRKEAEKDNLSHPTSCSRTSDLPSKNEEFKLNANENLEKVSKVSADENIRHTKESAEQNTNFSKSSVVPAMNFSPETKNVSEAATSKITAQQTSASIIAAPQATTSGKTTLQMNTSSSDIAQSNASANDTLLGNISTKATSQTSVLAKSTVCTNSSENPSLQTDTDISVKTVSQKNILLTTSDTKPLVKATQQLDTSLKAVSLTDDSVKVASKQNASVKAIPPTITAEKTTPQKNASVKTSSPQAKAFQQKTVSLKADPQIRAPLRASQLSSSLNEYLTMVSKPIVGLNYVVETLMYNGQSRFQCNLCKVNGNNHVMKEHINSTKHYLEYLRTVDPINAAEVTPLKETERNQKILELVTELERKKGRGTILVKTAETEKDNKDDLLTTGDTTRKEYAGYASHESDTIGSAINIVAQEFLSKDVIRNAQKRDPNTFRIIKELMDGVQNSSYIMHDDILYERRNGKYRVVVAKTMKQAIYESYHFSLCRKTPGAVTYINDSYSWSGINEDITKFAKQCYVCQIRKLRQLSGGEAIPILVRRGQAKRKPSPTKRAFNDLTNAEIEDTQRRDPDTMKVISDTENGLETNQHVIYENILYILDENGQYKIVVSPQMKKLLFEKNHSVLCWKSTERPPIINAITQVYFWQRMLEEVKLFAVKCKKCRTNIPVKRISEQVSTTPSGKTLKKSTEKIKDAETQDESKEKNQDAVTKDIFKERTREEPKEKSSRNIPWDKTKSLKPPIVEQKILTKDMVRDAQKKDSNTSKIIKLLTDGVPSSSYILYEGILYQEKNGKYLTMVADKMKQSIYEKFHSTLCSRYTGRSSQRDGTKYINRQFSWPAISQDVYIFVKNCHVCQIRTLRTKAFSRPSEERQNNKFVISASRSAFNDLTDSEITAAQRKDPGTLKLIILIEDGVHISRHILYEGILYCLGGHGDYKVVISPEMKETIYQNNHFLLCWESTVWQSTVDTIAQVYLWPRIHEDIRDFMETCQVCKREFPEQSYIDQLAYTTAVPEGDKTVGGLMEQYHQMYSDPTYCATQQYQNNYPVLPIDPYAAGNSATYPYGTYPQYWNTSADSMVTYPTLSSGKRPADDDTDSNIKEHSTVSYNERKRCRSDLGTEYEYSRSQNDRRPPTSFKAQEPLDQTMPLAASEFNKPNEPENSNNTFGFTITNAEDAEVTLDIMNSLMHIYLKYQLKKLHGPVQKLLQESLKEEEAKESVDSNTNNATNSDTHELFVRLPRLHKGKKTEVKQSIPYPANSGRISSSSFCQSSLDQHPYNKKTHILPESSVLKSSRSFNPSLPSRNDTVDTLSSKKSDLPKTSSFFPKNLHSTDDDKTSILNDDIDGFPMTGEIPDPTDKVSCNWEDDIDGKPLITESSFKISKKHNVADSIHNSPKKIDNVKDFPVRCMTNPSLNKSLKNKDDDIDGIPLGSRTNKSFDSSTNKPSSTLNKPEGGSNDSKDGPFLKPSSTNIFKKPPDDWDKNANKTIQAVKGSSLTKSQSDLSESSDDVISDTKTLSDKYPNWKKGGMQGGTSFYNSPLYNKANEGVASTSSTTGSNAPVIDLFKRYRRVQL